jgi:hypothetical protein
MRFSECERCNDLNESDIIDSFMLCAGVPDRGKYICEGDSGDPVCDQEGAQVGVENWGYGCARDNLPGIYSFPSPKNQRHRYSAIALVLWSLASPPAISVPRVALSPRLLCNGNFDI